MTTNTNTQSAQQAPVQSAPAALPEDDFFSDAPLVACPLRRPGDDSICEACQ